jgi:hypothetical protein
MAVPNLGEFRIESECTDLPPDHRAGKRGQAKAGAIALL